MIKLDTIPITMCSNSENLLALTNHYKFYLFE